MGERLCQPCSLLVLLFTHLRFIACSVFMVLQLVLRLFWLREYLFFFGSCSFARSEHRCQRCSLFILPFNLAPHRIICFHVSAACASMILTSLYVPHDFAPCVDVFELGFALTEREAVLGGLGHLLAVSLVLSVSASVALCSFCFERGFALTECGNALRRLGLLRAISLVLSVSASVALCPFCFLILRFIACSVFLFLVERTCWTTCLCFDD